MKIINGHKLNECFRYYRNKVTDEDIQEALDEYQEQTDEYQEQTDKLEDFYCYIYNYNVDDLKDLKVAIDDLNEYYDLLSNYNTVEQARQALEDADNFWQDLNRTYEYEHGRVFAPPLEQFGEMVCEDIVKRVEYEKMLEEIRDAIKEDDFNQVKNIMEGFQS